GRSGIGVFRPTNGIIFLKNNPTVSGYADINIIFGIPNDKPIAGRWVNTSSSPQQPSSAPTFIP
ncbi:MAG: hypothetical protein ABI947_16940, partial [Chloroflexota bacterium]